MAGSQCLCAVNKVLLFKHIRAWQFSFPRHVAARVSLPGRNWEQASVEEKQKKKEEEEEDRRVLVLVQCVCESVCERARDQQLTVCC